jgi:tRNA G18 (ribose-2'-O)-methylase SpoU
MLRVGILRIDDPGDPRIAAYRNVPDPDLLFQEGLFVAEGRLVVRRLIEGQRFSVRSVMVTEAARASLSDVLTGRDELPVYVVAQAVMNGITGFNIHRGCLAIGQRPRPRDWRDVMTGARRVIALERIANADNVGSVFRSAAAFGIDAVLLERTCTDPLYRKAIRTSMGAALAMPFATAEPWPDVLRQLSSASVGRVLSASAEATADRSSKSEGWSDPLWTVVALTTSATAAPLREVAAAISHRPVVILVGNEGEGLTEAALGACTHRARIPMTNGVDSLNVATAAAIAMYELNQVSGAG